MKIIQLLLTATVLSTNGSLQRRMMQSSLSRNAESYGGGKRMSSSPYPRVRAYPTSVAVVQSDYDENGMSHSKRLRNDQSVTEDDFSAGVQDLIAMRSYNPSSNLLLPPNAHISDDEMARAGKIEAQLKYQMEHLSIIRSFPTTIVKSEKTLLNFARDPSKKLTLILDLDETLAHCSQRPSFRFKLYDLQIGEYFSQRYCIFRPEYILFLQRASAQFEVIVFTAAGQLYADQVIDAIDPENKYITHRLYRQHCTYVDGWFVKDIDNLGRPLSQVIALDNSIVAFAYNLDNLMPIASFYDDRSDRELMSSLKLIEIIAASRNVQVELGFLFQLKNRISVTSTADDSGRRL